MSKFQKLIEMLDIAFLAYRRLRRESIFKNMLCRKMSDDALKKRLCMRGRNYLLTLDRNFNLIRKHE